MKHRNFHTHTSLCMHAAGTVEDYCRCAVEQGVDALGFSDHNPCPDGRWSAVRMPLNKLQFYVDEISAARKKFPELKILKGLECDFVPDFLNFYKDCYLGEYKLNYLVGAIHSYWYNGRWESSFGASMNASQLHAYTECAVNAISSGIFAFLAHPDVFGVCYRGWDKEAEACARTIASAAANYNVPLEINAYGLRKEKIEDNGTMRYMYPWINFWEIAAEYPIKVLANSDAHQPVDVWGNTDQSLEIAAKFNLEAVNSTFLNDILNSSQIQEP